MENEAYLKLKSVLDKNVQDLQSSMFPVDPEEIDEKPDEVVFRERSIALGGVLDQYDQTNGKLGQMMLTLLWEMKKDHVFELGFESDDAYDYVYERRGVPGPGPALY